MSHSTLALLAASPLFIAGILIIAFRTPAKYAMPISFISAAIISVTVWKVDVLTIAAASIEGLVISTTLLYIIFGALMLLAVLTATGAIRRIQQGFNSITSDRRVQAVILVWTFGTFLEGASGFGSSAAVTAPIMLAMGFPALAAVMVGLLVQTAPVTFGAVGTPIVIGVTNGLHGSELVDKYLESTGSTYAELVHQISYQTAFYHLLIAVATPLFISIMLTYFFGEKRSLRRGFDIAPFALFAGLAMLVPYFLCAYFLGPEFPSMFGGLAGLGIILMAARRGFLMPKKPFDFPDKEAWPKRWMGSVPIKPHGDTPNEEQISLLRAWSPYIVVALVIAITRLVPEVKGWLTQVSFPITFSFNDILGTQISASAQYLYSPGTALIIGALFGLVVQRVPSNRFYGAVGLSAKQALAAGVVLFSTLPMVRVLIRSGDVFNDSGLPSMPVIMAEVAAEFAGTYWPLVSPWIGALGAFIAGSNTVSNLTFSLFQFSTGHQIGIDPKGMVVTQAVGGAGGNPISIHNVVAASATVGLLGREGDLIRKSGIVTIYYCIAAGIIGSVSAFGLGLNTGTILLISFVLAWASFVLYAMRKANKPQHGLLKFNSPGTSGT
ncbi:MAG TPA: L-lactate permease [Marinobacter salarius]|jgi:lactate permease|uniref:L-lactate permease n=1 Tax=Marinobacter salarius TaxID=1420917 RepID=UPI0018F1A059|nr:L-lactate permease [Marinobacter salarius]MBJ7299536.1 L-lactate permease [Marinobacter salarius]HIO98136.1 L-lactate permease [Marinobacter salarius]